MKIPQIYILIDPITNDVRYVGKTVSLLQKRLWNHCRDKSITHKTSWIKSLKENGLKPLIRTVELCNENELNDREIYWIYYFRKIYNLTNLTDGGDGLPIGFKHSVDTKKKISESSKKENNGKFKIGHKRLNDEKALENIKKNILVYDIDGNFIKEIKGIKTASVILNINKNLISSCLKNHSEHTKEFRFFYYFDNYPIKIDSIRDKIILRNRKIKEYKNGIFIKEYLNAKEASDVLKISYKALNNILNGKAKNSIKYPDTTWIYN